MNEQVKGKRLLLLGGSANMVNMTKQAQNMGCIVYVTDYYDTVKSPAKLAADYYADISITDYESILKYIKENKIDGVLTGYTDSYLEHYLKICEMAGLPHYGSEKSFAIATDKMVFKKACIAAGVGVIPGVNAYDFKTVEEFAIKNGFPVILKPVDNSGSRGVAKCNSHEDLEKCYEYALSFSRSKNVIVEKYMDCDSIGVVYQILKGKARLAAVCDRVVYSAEASGSAIVSETRYPSKYLDRYLTEANLKMISFLERNSFTDGMVSPMAFVDERGFYMCEMCYRPSGGHHFTLINDQNGVDGLALLIEFAVTGKNDRYNPENENPYFKECCGMIHILGESGRVISHIDGIEKIKGLNWVLEVSQALKEKQMIGKDGTTAQIIMSVWLKAPDWNSYNKRVEMIKDILVVEDEKGKTLIK